MKQKDFIIHTAELKGYQEVDIELTDNTILTGAIVEMVSRERIRVIFDNTRQSYGFNSIKSVRPVKPFKIEDRRFSAQEMIDFAALVAGAGIDPDKINFKMLEQWAKSEERPKPDYRPIPQCPHN